MLMAMMPVRQSQKCEKFHLNAAEQTNAKFRLIKGQRKRFPAAMWRRRSLQGPAKIQTNDQHSLWAMQHHQHGQPHAESNKQSSITFNICLILFYNTFIYYLPGCHAVKKKHDNQELAHFTNTVSTNDSSKLDKFFILNPLATRCEKCYNWL